MKFSVSSSGGNFEFFALIELKKWLPVLLATFCAVRFACRCTKIDFSMRFPLRFFLIP